MRNLAIFVCSSFVLLAIAEGSLCPDKKTHCRATQTCCSDLKGSYGCCPYNNATCCPDGNHCCPHDTECDIAHSRCVPKPKVRGWTIIYDSFAPHELDDQQQKNASEFILENQLGDDNSTFDDGERLLKKKCPDGGRFCPDKYTCCNLATGGYGCCPFENAMCCPDKVHCCPNGQKCDGQANSCV